MNMINLFTIVKAQGAVVPLEPKVTIEILFSQLISWGFYLGGAIAVIYLILGGVNYITAGGDQAKAEKARNTITYAIIGIFVIALSFVIVEWSNQAALGTLY